MTHARASRGVPVYSQTFTGTHSAYPWRDGQAEWTSVPGSAPRWFSCPEMVAHPGTNRARCSTTSLITLTQC